MDLNAYPNVIEGCSIINEQIKPISIENRENVINDTLYIGQKDYQVNFNHIHLIFTEISYKPIKIKIFIKLLLQLFSRSQLSVVFPHYLGFTNYIKEVYDQLSNIEDNQYSDYIDTENTIYLPFAKYAVAILSYYRYQLLDNKEYYQNLDNTKFIESQTITINRTNLWYSDMLNHYAFAFRGTKISEALRANGSADSLIAIGQLQRSSRNVHNQTLYDSLVKLLIESNKFGTLNANNQPHSLPKISLTGHSLGGALCTLLNKSSKLKPFIIYTYNKGAGINSTAIKDAIIAAVGYATSAAHAAAEATAKSIRRYSAPLQSKLTSVVNWYMPPTAKKIGRAAANTMTHYSSKPYSMLTSTAQQLSRMPLSYINYATATQPAIHQNAVDTIMPDQTLMKYNNQINYYIDNDPLSILTRSHTASNYHTRIIQTNFAKNEAHQFKAFLDSFEISNIIRLLQIATNPTGNVSRDEEIIECLNKMSISPQEQAEDNLLQVNDGQEEKEINELPNIHPNNENNEEFQIDSDEEAFYNGGGRTKITKKYKKKTTKQKNASKKQNTSSKSSAVKSPTKTALHKPTNINNTPYRSVTSKPAPKTHKKTAKPISAVAPKLKNNSAIKANTVKPVSKSKSKSDAAKTINRASKSKIKSDNAAKTIKSASKSKSKNDAAKTTTASNKKISVSTKQPKIHLGKRGGQYYLKNGNKIYI